MITKKGQATEYVAVAIALTVFIMVAVLGLLIYQDFTGQYDMSSEQASVWSKVGDIFESLNNITLFVMGGLIIGVTLNGYRLRTNKVYFVINFVLGGIVLLVIPVLSNALTEFMTTDALSSTNPGVNFPVMVWIRDNLPSITIVGLGILLLAMYMSDSNSGGIRV
jgi:sorbitol-specific phosphotransferase system component IIC